MHYIKALVLTDNWSVVSLEGKSRYRPDRNAEKQHEDDDRNAEKQHGHVWFCDYMSNSATQTLHTVHEHRGDPLRDVAQPPVDFRQQSDRIMWFLAPSYLGVGDS